MGEDGAKNAAVAAGSSAHGEYWPQLAEHQYRFAMAGLAAVRESLEAKDHDA